jgi:hypothetical protein
MDDRLKKQAISVIATTNNPWESIGALSLLKTLGDRQATLLWNYVLTEISENRIPHYEQIRMKYMVTDEDTPFWAISSDGDLIRSSQTSPKSFWAPDRESAVLYADVVLSTYAR